MKTIVVRCPKWAKSRLSEWPASYAIGSSGNFRLINIESRSALTVTVGKAGAYFYIGCPSYFCSVPPVCDLAESFWISEYLVGSGVPMVDAVTIVQVLADIAKSAEVSSDD